MKSKFDRDLFLVLSLIDGWEVFWYRTKLQKLVFLAKRKYGFKTSFKFTPYYFGPYSHELQSFIEKLISDGILIEKNTNER